MVKMEDVARLAGVSLTTVSRFLNNDETFSISKKTEARILRAVNKLGYQSPNTLKYKKHRMSSFSPGSVNIGYIISWDINSYDENFFSGIIQGISQELSEHKQHLAFSYRVDDLSNLIVQNKIISNNYDGVIIIGAVPPKTFDLIIKNINHQICIFETPENSTIDCITVDFEKYAYMLTDFLIKQGHRKIVFIGGPTYGTLLYSSCKTGNYYNYEARLRGYLKAHMDNNIEINEKFILDAGWIMENAYEQTKELLTQACFTAIFASCDRLGIGAMRAINESNLSVPDDISIVGYDDSDVGRYLTPPITTVQYAQKGIGRLAVKMLLDQIHNNDRFNEYEVGKRIIFPQKILHRDSVKTISVE